MKSIFKGYHVCLIAILLAVLIFAPIAQRALAGWEHFDPNNTTNLPSSHIMTLAMDPNRLWIGTDQGLVEKMLSSSDPNIGWIKDPRVDPNLYAPIASMDIDQNMVLWLGTKQGLISYDPESSDPNNPFTYSGLSFIDSHEIRDIEVDTDFVWIATDTGLNRFNKSSETWVRYSDDPNDPNGFDSSAAWEVESGDDDTIWVLPSFPNIFGGVYRYTVSTDQWDRFSAKAGPGQTDVIFNSLIMGDSNDIWLGSYVGLWRFETNHPDPNNAWTQWEDANSGLPSNDVHDIAIYRGSNRIIVATIDGIARYDLGLGLWQSISTPVYLDLGSQIITDILVDPNRNQVWFGTEEDGLYRWKEGAIIWSNPADGAENVSVKINAIEIMFNDRIDPSSIELGSSGSSLTFEMFDSDDNLITDSSIYDPNDFTWRFVDSNININLIIEPNQPDYDLYPDTWYSFTFTTDILYHSSQSIGYVDTRVKFKTQIVPEVVDTGPDPNATDVNPYAPIQIWFNKSMDQNSFFPNMISFKAEGDIFFTPINEEEMTFPDPNHLIISISGDPPLKPGTKYTFTVNENVTDLSGNPLSESFEFQFTTKAAPQVLTVIGSYPYPENLATNVSIDTNIAVLFTSPMDTNSVEASFGLNPTVTGEFLWLDSDTKFVFQPDNPLTSAILYEVTIDTNARDKDGIPLGNPFTWSFTTGGTPVILSTLPQENEDLVSIYTNIEIRFSSPMDESSAEGAFSLLDDQNTTVSGGFSWNQDSTELRFIPSDPLDPNHNYEASITTSAQSQSGIQLSQGKTWGFTTVSLKTISPPEGGWPVFHIMGMDPNSISVTAMAMNPKDGGIWAGLTSLDPNSNWMGIGLFHYNGIEWKQYTSSDPSCGLTSDYINDLAFDSQGNLWIATEPDQDGAGGGVNMFDGQMWHWYDPNTFYGLSNIDELLYSDFLYVNAIDVYTAGTEDMIWIAATGGIVVGRYSTSLNDWEWSATTEFPFTSLIAVDQSGGTVWVASGLFMNNPNEPCNSIAGFDAEGLSRWQPDIWDPNFRVWSPDGGLSRKKSPVERMNSNLRAMKVDGYGNLWLGTKDRLYKINIDDLLAGECNFESCDYIETKGGLLPDSIYDIIVNPSNTNELWVSTDSGISILEITKPIKSPDSWTIYPMPDVMVLTMLPGLSGSVYAGTDKGLLIIGEPTSPEIWILSTYPVQGGQSVPIDLMVIINFTQPMDTGSTQNAFCLQVDPNIDPGSACLNGSFTWSNGNRAFEFTPSETLDEETDYILTIDTNAKDQNGVAMPVPFTLKFITESISWVHTTDPEDGEQSVPIDLEVIINFTREMDQVTTNNAFCLRKDPSNYGESLVNNPCVEGTFEWFNGNYTLRFIPNEDLSQGIKYMLTINETAEDINGVVMSVPYSLKFKTVSAQRKLIFEGEGCFIQSLLF